MVGPADDQVDVAVIFYDKGPEAGAHGVGAELIGALTRTAKADVGPGQVTKEVDVAMPGVVVDPSGSTVGEGLNRPPLFAASDCRYGGWLRGYENQACSQQHAGPYQCAETHWVTPFLSG
jgi:hypothetical protein